MTAYKFLVYAVYYVPYAESVLLFRYRGVENHLQKDGSVTIPEALQPYMGGKKAILPKN